MKNPRKTILVGLCAAAGAAIAARLTGAAAGDATAAGALLIGYAAFSIASGSVALPRFAAARLGLKEPRRQRPGEALQSFLMAVPAGAFALAASSDAFVAFMAAIATYGASEAAHAIGEEREAALALASEERLRADEAFRARDSEIALLLGSVAGRVQGDEAAAAAVAEARRILAGDIASEPQAEDDNA